MRVGRSSYSRRELLRVALGTGAACLAASLGCRRSRQRAEEARPKPGGSARYFVFLFLSGGHDTVFTTDPKRAGEVDRRVTLPSENQIVEAGGLRLGPHFAPLQPWASRMTILNGVQVGTANHETGFKQFFRLKSNTISHVPTALDVIGLHRDQSPLGAIYLNLSHRVLHSPAYFGTADRFYYGPANVFEEAEAAEPEELRAAASALREEAQALARRPRSRQAEVTASAMRDVAAFFERMRELPPLTVDKVSDDYVAQSMSAGLERAAWILEHDLARCVGVDLGLLGWDTHIGNEVKQAEMNGNFVRYLASFLRQLEVRRNRNGTLLDNTVVVCGSDLGRFPQVNDMLGKDHLPQTAFFFFGPGFARGRAFGRTGPRMESLPISYKTGEPAKDGRIVGLDDVGATVLALAGLEPDRYGYAGKRLEFLLDSAT